MQLKRHGSCSLAGRDARLCVTVDQGGCLLPIPRFAVGFHLLIYYPPLNSEYVSDADHRLQIT
jgi:hypothetical protein